MCKNKFVRQLILVSVIGCNNSYAATCMKDHGVSQELKTDVRYIHNNDYPFQQNTPLVKKLEPAVLLNTEQYNVSTLEAETFTGSLSSGEVTLTGLNASPVEFNLSMLDLFSYPSNHGAEWPETVQSGVEKHTILVKQAEVRLEFGMGRNASVSWSNTRDYVLKHFEYRTESSVDKTVNSMSEGFLYDANNNKLRVRVLTRVQESGVSKKRCGSFEPSRPGTRGYGVHIYPVFQVQGVDLDSDSEISSLTNPINLDGYKGTVVLYWE